MEDLSHYNPEGSDLRRAQMRLLDMLDVFDAICRRNGIAYWLDWGTLLGARRHGGFIPWDDDIDVCILQRDCKKLVAALMKELPPDLQLQTRETDKKYWYYFPRIRDKRSRHYNKRGDVFEYNGIFFDIFLIEPIPSLAIKSVIDRFLRSENRFKKADTLAKKIKYGLMFGFLPAIKLTVVFLRFFVKYILSSRVYARGYGGANYTRYNINDILPVGDIMFEGRKCMAPRNVDQYLINQFGTTFMELPEPSKRYTHSSKIEFFT